MLEALADLSNQAAGIVIEYINGDVKATCSRIAREGIWIGTGIAGMVLSFLEKTEFMPAVCVGLVVGFVLTAGGRWYAMTCKEEANSKFNAILKALNEELKKYEESQGMIFEELKLYHIFNDNLQHNVRELQRQIIETTYFKFKELLLKLDKRCHALMKEKSNPDNYVLNFQCFAPAVAFFESSAHAVNWKQFFIFALNTLAGAFLLKADWEHMQKRLDMVNKWDGDRKSVLEEEEFHGVVDLQKRIVEIRDRVIKGN